MTQAEAWDQSFFPHHTWSSIPAGTDLVVCRLLFHNPAASEYPVIRPERSGDARHTIGLGDKAGSISSNPLFYRSVGLHLRLAVYTTKCQLVGRTEFLQRVRIAGGKGMNVR